ncbi:hypothetical protein [Paractinoplanes durhamensis]|uniref:hypothetical protein n=1 Tax=Paractinoplanes durhamensis TaxID=113563 RepID=UPI00362946E2
MARVRCATARPCRSPVARSSSTACSSSGTPDTPALPLATSGGMPSMVSTTPSPRRSPASRQAARATSWVARQSSK